MFINTQRLNSTQEKETGGFRSEHRSVKSEEISGWRKFLRVTSRVEEFLLKVSKGFLNGRGT